jgi:hypothetical protein
MRAAALFAIVNEFGGALSSICNGPDTTIPEWIGHVTWRILLGHPAIDIRRWEEREAGKRRGGVQMSELGVSAQV